MTPEAVIDGAATAALVLLSISLVVTVVLALVRRSAADKVVALDVLSFLAVGIVATIAFDTRVYLTLDAAAVPALVGFVATVAMSRFIGRAGRPR